MGLGFVDQGWAYLGLFGEIPRFLDMGLGLLNTCHLSLCFLNIRLNKTKVYNPNEKSPIWMKLYELDTYKITKPYSTKLSMTEGQICTHF